MYAIILVPHTITMAHRRTLPVRLGHHSSPRTISGVERRAAPAAAFVGTPAGLAGEDGVVEAVEGAGACAIDEGCVAQERDVVEAEVPDGGVDHAVGAEGHDGANDGAGEDVVPVVVFVDGEGAADQAGTEEGCVDGDELPHGRVVVGVDLELSVQVKVQEHEASKGSGGVTRWHRLERVVDLLAVPCADTPVEHDLAVTVGSVAAECRAVFNAVVITANRRENVGWDDGLAYGEEVRSQTTNEPLDEDLEDGSGDERVQQTDSGVVDVPERAGTDLHNEEDSEWDEEGHESCGPL